MKHPRSLRLRWNNVKPSVVSVRHGHRVDCKEHETAKEMVDICRVESILSQTYHSHLS